MIKRKLIKVPIYDHIIDLVVFNKLDELKRTKYWGSVSDYYKENGFSALTIDYFGTSKSAILIPKGNLDFLVHELVHVKNYLYRRKKLENTDEHEAYLMEYLFSKCKDFVIK